MLRRAGGALTGPFGYVVIGLSEGRVCETEGDGMRDGEEWEREGGCTRDYRTLQRLYHVKRDILKEVCFGCNCWGVTKSMCVCVCFI
jgi:hypothetical protein